MGRYKKWLSQNAAVLLEKRRNLMMASPFQGCHDPEADGPMIPCLQNLRDAKMQNFQKGIL
jgi:hypothetical protein